MIKVMIPSAFGTRSLELLADNTIPVPPNTAARGIYFRFDGSLRYEDPAGGPDRILSANKAYSIGFKIVTPTPSSSAEVLGQQLDWDEGCWPWLCVGLGQTKRPGSMVPTSATVGRPCTYATALVSPGTGIIVVQADHFTSIVNMNRMFSITPAPDKELIFMGISTNAVTTAEIIIA